MLYEKTMEYFVLYIYIYIYIYNVLLPSCIGYRHETFNTLLPLFITPFVTSMMITYSFADMNGVGRKLFGVSTF